MIKEMLTKVVRSRFPHAVGDKVEGGTVVEVKVVIPPEPSLNRRGVYEYVVEVPPAAASTGEKHVRKKPAASESSHSSPPSPDSYIRTTPEEMGSRLIRRVPGR
jgi:hypothetical protein